MYRIINLFFIPSIFLSALFISSPTMAKSLAYKIYRCDKGAKISQCKVLADKVQSPAPGKNPMETIPSGPEVIIFSGWVSSGLIEGKSADLTILNAAKKNEVANSKIKLTSKGNWSTLALPLSKKELRVFTKIK